MKVKPIPCSKCGANTFTLELVTGRPNGRRNLLRARCVKCGTARDTAVGLSRAVNKGPARRKNKEELL